MGILPNVEYIQSPGKQKPIVVVAVIVAAAAAAVVSTISAQLNRWRIIEGNIKTTKITLQITATAAV